VNAADCSSLTRAVRCGVVLILVSALAGCATASGLQFQAPHAFTPSPRLLLAMSDGPTANGEPTGPAAQGYHVPGRNPDSRVPWEFFLGNAAHRMIAYMYGVNHPDNEAYYNTETLRAILTKRGLGDASRLLPDERKICPDITDVSSRNLFEIKPWNEQGLLEGREEAKKYLVALNRALLSGRPFTGGKDFHGEILIRFAKGEYIWRLEWRTTEPGVVQYRWTRSQQRFESEAEAYNAAQWLELTEQELRQYGGWVAQAMEGMVNRREKLATFSGAVGIVIDVVGELATGFFSGAILGQMGSGTGTQQPPTQGGGQVIPFTTRPPPTAPPVRVPAAAIMPLPQ
jgi:hypothetical protein